MSSILGYGFKYKIEARLPCGQVIEFEDGNLLPQSAVNHNAGLIRGTVAPIGAWYMGLFEGDFAPTRSVSAADLPGIVGEFTSYSEAQRPAWLPHWKPATTWSCVSTPAQCLPVLMRQSARRPCCACLKTGLLELLGVMLWPAGFLSLLARCGPVPP